MDLDKEKAPEKIIWGNNPMDKIQEVPVVGLNGDFYFGPQEKIGDYIPYTGSVMSIDPSGRGQDELGYAVVKMLNGQLFVTEAGGLQGGYREDVLKKLAVIAARNSVNYIIIESNFGDGMFTELFKPVVNKIHPVSIEEVRHNIQKEKRIIDTLEPVMNQHKLIFDRKLIVDDYKTVQGYASEKAMRYSLFYQMTRLTKDKGSLQHDDRLDALAIAVNYWVEQMAADAEKNMEMRRVDLLHKALDDFVDGVTDRNKRSEQPLSWL
jgi:Holliday junction resolvasome RuvABC endonuclease subunit